MKRLEGELAPRYVQGERKYVIVVTDKGKTIVRFVDPASCLAHADMVQWSKRETALSAGRVTVDRKTKTARITDHGSHSLDLPATQVDEARDLPRIYAALGWTLPAPADPEPELPEIDRKIGYLRVRCGRALARDEAWASQLALLPGDLHVEELDAVDGEHVGCVVVLAGDRAALAALLSEAPGI